MRQRATWVMLTLCASLWPANARTVGVVSADLSLAGAELVTLPGIAAQASQRPQADGARAGVEVTFEKASPERRLLALRAKPGGDLTGMASTVWRGSVRADDGLQLRPAMVLFDRHGGVFYRLATHPLAANGLDEFRLGLSPLRRATFSDSSRADLDWSAVEQVWFGVVVDGAGRGVLSLSEAWFTDEPFRPTRPLDLPEPTVQALAITKDEAVKVTPSVSDTGPQGQPCLKLDFTLATGRHMYLIPRLPMGATDGTGYRALRFVARVQLPPGLKGLLVSLFETSGSQYIAEPTVASDGAWHTVVIPFDSFKLGSWSNDANNRLDPGELASLAIGVHGTAGGDGRGALEICDLALEP